MPENIASDSQPTPKLRHCEAFLFWHGSCNVFVFVHSFIKGGVMRVQIEVHTSESDHMQPVEVYDTVWGIKFLKLIRVLLLDHEKGSAYLLIQRR